MRLILFSRRMAPCHSMNGGESGGCKVKIGVQSSKTRQFRMFDKLTHLTSADEEQLSDKWPRSVSVGARSQI